MAGQETWAGEAARLAQGSCRNRNRNAGIREIAITARRIGDAQVQLDLLDQIAADQRIGLVTADGAYDTRACHTAIAARAAAAVIPPHKNGKRWKEQTAGAAVRNDALRSCQRLGRAN